MTLSDISRSRATWLIQGLLCPLLLFGALPSAALSPGANLLNVNRDPALFEVLETASNPIVSPDGKHLYFSRASHVDGTIAVFGLEPDGDNSPFFIETYTAGPAGLSSLTGNYQSIQQFNAEGTRAYANFRQAGVSENDDVVHGLSVLIRNPATGGLSELQAIVIAAGTAFGAPVISADNQFLYVSTHVADSNLRVDNAELRRYSLDPETGRLQGFVSLPIPRANQLSYLRLIDNDTALLASSSTELVEYRRDSTSGNLTLQNRFTLPPLFVVNPDNPIDPPGPVATAVTADGEFVYSLRANLVNRGGGFLNTLRRNRATGALTLIDELTPIDFVDNFLFRSTQILLSDAEDIALVPSYHGRFIAGSPSLSSCINAFAIDPDDGTLRRTGTDCKSNATGSRWAAHPQTNRFYTSWSTARSIFVPDEFPFGSIAVWEPGRIVQATTIHSAILPLSRSIGERDTNTEPATYFTSIINAGNADAEHCSVIYDGNGFVNVGFQVNDPVTNEPLGDVEFSSLGGEFDIPADSVRQLTLSVFQSNEFDTQTIELDYRCLNSPDAPRVRGVNNLLIASSRLPLPDLITGAVTQGNTGIARLPGTGGTAAFAVSTINIGAEDELTARVVFDLAELIETSAAGAISEASTASLQICETNPATGACLASPTSTAVRRIANQEIATYTVFVIGGGSEIPLDPATNRAFVVLVDSMGEVRGASSVAITTAP